MRLLARHFVTVPDGYFCPWNVRRAMRAFRIFLGVRIDDDAREELSEIQEDSGRDREKR